MQFKSLHWLSRYHGISPIITRSTNMVRIYKRKFWGRFCFCLSLDFHEKGQKEERLTK